MAGIVTVTLNPALDIYAATERLAPTRKLRCTDERRDPGGGGVNVARVAHRLGANVLAVYTTGGVVGDSLGEMIQGEGVRSLCLPVSGETRESLTILEQSSAKEYRFVFPGPTLSADDWRACFSQLQGLKDAFEFIVLSGSLPPGAPDDAYAQIARWARSKGMRVVLDASGPALKPALDEGVFLIKPSLDELRDIVDAPLETLEDWIGACRALVDRKAAEIVALTVGDRGAVVATRDQAWRAESVKVDVVSSVGAGDSFLGAMVWALDAGRPLDEAFRHGVAAGTAALLTPGTQLSRPEDVRTLLPQVALSAI
jgi:6-phosphofructokinase 2